MALHSSEFLKKKRRWARLRAGIFLALALVLVSAVVYVSHMERFLISEIEVEGNAVTSDEEIKLAAGRAIEGKYLWLFPRANALIYPRGSVRESIFSDIPRIQASELELVRPRVLGIRVEERTPFALYCEDIERLSDPSGCYFVDENGFIFSKAPSFSGEVYFLYSSNEPITEPLGKKFLSREEFRRLSTLIRGVEALGAELRAFELKQSAGEHHFVLPNGGRIIWKSSQEFDKVARNLEAFLLDAEIVGQKNFFERILYIDLRFENKVYYKFQDTNITN